MSEDDWASVFRKKSNCYTMKHKYPRTTSQLDYQDFSKISLREEGFNIYREPLPRCWPKPPLKRCRPIDPSIDPQVADEMRLAEDLNRRGRKTPLEAVHLGYRSFSLDPSKKTLRHYNDPIPHPLATTTRASYTDPKEKPHLIYYSRHIDDRVAAIGIVPEVMVSPYPPVVDTSWSKDYKYEPPVYTKVKKGSM